MLYVCLYGLLLKKVLFWKFPIETYRCVFFFFSTVRCAYIYIYNVYIYITYTHRYNL